MAHQAITSAEVFLMAIRRLYPGSTNAALNELGSYALEVISIWDVDTRHSTMPFGNRCSYCCRQHLVSHFHSRNQVLTRLLGLIHLKAYGVRSPKDPKEDDLLFTVSCTKLPPNRSTEMCRTWAHLFAS